MKIRLTTRQGATVAEGELPPFNERPDVVFWGLRVFTLDGPSTAGVAGFAGLVVYREAFAVALVPEQCQLPAPRLVAVPPRSNDPARGAGHAALTACPHGYNVRETEEHSACESCVGTRYCRGEEP